MTVDAVVRCLKMLAPPSLERPGECNAAHARFKSPFNDVRGVAAISHVFSHRFEQLETPRFVIRERVVEGHAALLAWGFHFGVRLRGRRHDQVIHGGTHLKPAPVGAVLPRRA